MISGLCNCRGTGGQAKLLLADEPTGAPDSNPGGGVMRLFEGLHDLSLIHI